jgi:large subunit ribosomal protein L16
VQPGTVILEIGGVSKEDAQEALRLASHKLSIKTRFITKKDI